MESTKGNMVLFQTFQTYQTNNNETHNVVMKRTMLKTQIRQLPHITPSLLNNAQDLNKTTILRPLYLLDANDCFWICIKLSNIQSHKSSRFLDNFTSLSGHKVSFMRA